MCQHHLYIHCCQYLNSLCFQVLNTRCKNIIKCIVCVLSVSIRGMPRKIGFIVVSSSSHEDTFSAKELMVHAPTVNGWRSSRYIITVLYFQKHVAIISLSFPLWKTQYVHRIFCRQCSYPQHITLQLVERSRVRKLQLLAHQYLIPAKVEFHIGDTLPETSTAGFPGQLRRLGWDCRLNQAQF